MLNAEWAEVEMLFREVDICGIIYLLPVLEVPRAEPGEEVRISRGTYNQALARERILQNR